MALGSVASFSLARSGYNHSVLLISFGIVLVNLVSGVIWLGFGTAIGRLLRSRKAWVIFNVSMGVLTAACVLLLALAEPARHPRRKPRISERINAYLLREISASAGMTEVVGMTGGT